MTKDEIEKTVADIELEHLNETKENLSTLKALAWNGTLETCGNIFEIKFSISADVWTLYHFHYFIGKPNAKLPYEIVWIPLETLDGILERKSFLNKPITENVVLALSSSAIRKYISSFHD